MTSGQTAELDESGLPAPTTPTRLIGHPLAALDRRRETGRDDLPGAGPVSRPAGPSGGEGTASGHQDGSPS